MWLRLIITVMFSSLLLSQQTSTHHTLSSELKQRLIQTVRKKFEISPNAQLTVIDEQVISGFKKVTIQSSTPGHPFEKQFYVSSDDTLVFE